MSVRRLHGSYSLVLEYLSCLVPWCPQHGGQFALAPFPPFGVKPEWPRSYDQQY